MIAPFFGWLERRAGPLLAAALFVGLVVPRLAALCRPLLAPAIFVLLTSTLLRIDWRQVAAHARRPAGALVVVLWLLLGAPLVMWALLGLIEAPPGLEAALVLNASSPVLIAVPAFALMIGLDASLALLVMVATSLLQPLVQPPLALLLLGIELEIGVGALMGRLALLIGGSAVVALAIRGWVGPQRIERAGPAIGGVSVLALIVFGIGLMDGLLATLIDRPGHLLAFLAGAVLGNYALQVLGALIFWGLGRRQGLTAGLASGNRNLATLVAVLGTAAEGDLTLYLACNQFPMYLVPALAGPIYRRLLAGQR
ncbi:MAG: hypothetical protein ACT4P2_07040 [Pseudomonadota bacterium]